MLKDLQFLKINPIIISAIPVKSVLAVNERGANVQLQNLLRRIKERCNKMPLRLSKIYNQGFLVGLGIGSALSLITFALDKIAFKLPFTLRFFLVGPYLLMNSVSLLLDMTLRSDFGKIYPSLYLFTILVPTIYGSTSCYLLDKITGVVLKKITLMTSVLIYLVINALSFIALLAFGFST